MIGLSTWAVTFTYWYFHAAPTLFLGCAFSVCFFKGLTSVTVLLTAPRAQLCPILCDPTDYSLPASSFHGISQARILKWVAVFFSRGSYWPRDGTCIFCITGGIFTTEPPGKRCQWLVSPSSLPLSEVKRLEGPVLGGRPFLLLSWYWQSLPWKVRLCYGDGSVIISPWLLFPSLCQSQERTFLESPPWEPSVLPGGKSHESLRL